MADAEKGTAFVAYMTDNFGGAGDPQYATSWWPLITDISVSGSTAEIKTDIYPDDEGEEVAKPIVSAALGFINSPEGARVGIDTVIVRAQDGTIIGRKSALGR